MDESRQAWHRAIRKAKTAFWRQQINDADSPTKAYALAKWAKPRSQFGDPPLKGPDGRIASDPKEKGEVFLRTLLEKAPRTSPPVEAGPALRAIPLSDELTEDEVEDALLRTASTTPGEDLITTTVIKTGWAALKGPVGTLYRASVRLGYYPKVFKKSRTVMIPKVGKRDLTDISSWRPIALLNYLGKGLERLLARKIAHETIRHQITAKTHFGALPKRSTTDLVSCFISDVKEALDKGKSMAALFLDIKGAFDTVTYIKLLGRLRL